MRNKRLLGIIVGVLVVAVVAFLAVGLIFENSLPGQLLRGTAAGGGQQPTYASASVDGNIGEWDLSGDFFANMYRAFNASKTVETKLYLRYDCGANIMYALVLTAGDWPVLVDGDAWITINGIDSKVSFINFAWVNQGYDGNSGHAKGWEASFSLGQGNYTIGAHTNVDHGGSQTSGIANKGTGLTIQCYQTTAVFLSNFTATNTPYGVQLRWETASEVQNMGFNVYYGTSPDGPWTKLNPSLIPSKVPPGSPTGAKYDYLHQPTSGSGSSRRSLTKSYYLLEDVDASGVATTHGPVTP